MTVLEHTSHLANAQTDAAFLEMVALPELTPEHFSLIASAVEFDIDTRTMPITDRLELAEEVIIWPWMRKYEFAGPNEDYAERRPRSPGLREAPCNGRGIFSNSVDIPAN